jgi:hypothetical protein
MESPLRRPRGATRDEAFFPSMGVTDSVTETLSRHTTTWKRASFISFLPTLLEIPSNMYHEHNLKRRRKFYLTHTHTHGASIRWCVLRHACLEGDANFCSYIHQKFRMVPTFDIFGTDIKNSDRSPAS